MPWSEGSKMNSFVPPDRADVQKMLIFTNRILEEEQMIMRDGSEFLRKCESIKFTSIKSVELNFLKIFCKKKLTKLLRTYFF